MTKAQMIIAIQDFLKGNIKDALEKFEYLSTSQKNNLDILYNYGRILGELEFFEKEQEMYRSILQINPNDIETLINLSVSLNATKNFSESIKYADRAIQINNGIQQAYESRGIARLGAINIDQGIRDLEQWIELILKNNKNLILKNFLKKCLQLVNIPPIYKDEEEIENTRNRIKKITYELIEIKNQITDDELKKENIGKKIAFKINQFYLAYQQKNDKYLNEKTVIILNKLLGNKEVNKPKKNTLNKKRKIAIISTFQFHPKLFIFDQIAEIDESKYEIEILIFNNRKFEINNHKYRAKYFSLKAETYDEIINKIKNENYDIVFFPDIGMSIVSKILSTQRLGKLTMTSWLHPVTSGSINVDIFLSGSLMEVKDSYKHYSEKLVLLPGIGLKIHPENYLVNPEEKEKRDFRIACIQTPFKYHPRMDKIFIQLAKKIPYANFIFIKLQKELDSMLMERINKNFTENNLKTERIKQVERMEGNEYSFFLQNMDIAIDSIGWSGGNTTLDLIGAGVPVMTIEGNCMRANHTAGIYKMIGMNDLIYKDEKDLIQGAITLSNNQDKLVNVKNNLLKNFLTMKTECYISNYINTLY